MIPVGTLCLIVGGGDPEMIGRECTVLSHNDTGELDDGGNPFDCVVDIDGKYTFRHTWRFWWWGTEWQGVYLFSELLPIPPLSDEVKNEKAETV